MGGGKEEVEDVTSRKMQRRWRWKQGGVCGGKEKAEEIEKVVAAYP